MEGEKSSHLRLLIVLFAMALMICVSCSEEKRDSTSLTRGDAANRNQSSYNNVVKNNKRNYNGGGGGGGGIGGGGGWGWGGGGGGWWGWGCRRQEKYTSRGSGEKGKYNGKHNGNHVDKNERGDEYIMGEYAQCMGRGRCRWRRLDCPLHCGGACFYDCKHMCKAHCRR